MDTFIVTTITRVIVSRLVIVTDIVLLPELGLSLCLRGLQSNVVQSSAVSLSIHCPLLHDVTLITQCHALTSLWADSHRLLCPVSPASQSDVSLTSDVGDHVSGSGLSLMSGHSGPGRGLALTELCRGPLCLPRLVCSHAARGADGL